jgi:ACS family hexuronate transporter-like MFS transporter
MLIDAAGLNRAISLALGLWSSAGIATGFTRGLGGLVGCRAVLGIAEAAGIPAAGKAIHQYLRPAERALGNAVNQAGVSLGLILAPPLATWLAVRYGWRQAFVVPGLLGLAWIPLWNWAARHAHAAPAPKLEPGAGFETLRDPRLWAFVAANALSMIGYSLWTNWTTLYLVEVHHLTLVEAAWYAWIPPLFATLGGVAGGWLSLRLVGRGMAAVPARCRVCLAAAAMSLVTAAIPAAPTAAWASAGISLSIFAVAAFSVNMYTLPLDVFGGPRAAFAVSILVASYGAVQAVVSPVFGKAIDLYGYAPVTSAAALMPLAACAVLWGTGSAR